ncbi:hypothetical protein NC652_008127 [Populus alba x Populus x berolinensis]|uniref:Uncharacterized protein n=1 Tax=Populus alba x Populus x berolinensis TaxID=444605 RepID=A0AAD6R626_9ROSI|nr:hypothetical protein NC652_008127 [Populus alba x Populus x berolinensis]KAJ7002868.1 hypothetical protein NC653_008167 [Populus alba x Populus x berolinensis]
MIKALRENHRLESLDDMDLRNSCFTLKPGCYLELQLSKLYTNKIFRTRQACVDGQAVEEGRKSQDCYEAIGVKPWI